MERGLPDGVRGRWLALGLTVAVLGALWVGVAAPLLGWHAERAEALLQREALARRMAGIVATVPELRRQAEAVAVGGPPERALLAGGSDAVAGAALQAQMQDMIREAGAALTSAEALTAEPVGAYRRIGLRVSVTASWPVLMQLLGAIADAAPRMLVDDVRLQGAPIAVGGAPAPLAAGFTVLAFRAQDVPAGGAPIAPAAARGR